MRRPHPCLTSGISKLNLDCKADIIPSVNIQSSKLLTYETVLTETLIFTTKIHNRPILTCVIATAIFST